MTRPGVAVAVTALLLAALTWGQAPPLTDDTVRLPHGGDDPGFKQPRAIAMVSPTYPSDAVEVALEGSVVVCFTVQTDGSVTDATVLSSTHNIFDEPARVAAAASTYHPARRDGAAVAHEMCLRYRFRL